MPRLLVVDLHGDLRHWNEVKPFLYPFMKDDQVLWCATERQGDFTDWVKLLYNQARTLLHRFRTRRFMTLFLVKLNDSQGPFALRLTRQAELVGQHFIEPLSQKKLSSESNCFLVIDHLQRNPAGGNPLDQTAYNFWELDLRGYARETARLWQFAEEDMEHLQKIWQWSKEERSGLTHDESLLTQELQDQVNKKKETIERAVETYFERQRTASEDAQKKGHQDLTFPDTATLERQHDQIRQNFLSAFAKALKKNDKSVLKDELPALLFRKVLGDCLSLRSVEFIEFLRLDSSDLSTGFELRTCLDISLFTAILAHLYLDNRQRSLLPGPTPGKVAISLNKESLQRVCSQYLGALHQAENELQNRPRLGRQEKVRIISKTSPSTGALTPEVALSSPPDRVSYFFRYKDYREWLDWHGELEEQMNSAYRNLQRQLDEFLEEIDKHQEEISDWDESKLNRIVLQLEQEYKDENQHLDSMKVNALSQPRWYEWADRKTPGMKKDLETRPKKRYFFTILVGSLAAMTFPGVFFALLNPLWGKGELRSLFEPHSGFLGFYFLGFTTLTCAAIGAWGLREIRNRIMFHINDAKDRAARDLQKMVSDFSSYKQYLHQLQKVECIRKNLATARRAYEIAKASEIKKKVHLQELKQHRAKCRFLAEELALRLSHEDVQDNKLEEINWHEPASSNKVYWIGQCSHLVDGEVAPFILKRAGADAPLTIPEISGVQAISLSPDNAYQR